MMNRFRPDLMRDGKPACGLSLLRLLLVAICCLFPDGAERGAAFGQSGRSNDASPWPKPAAWSKPPVAYPIDDSPRSKGTRYQPPAHQTPRKPTYLKPVSRNSEAGGEATGPHLFDPEYQEFPSTPPLGGMRGTRRPSEEASDSPAFQAIPKAGLNADLEETDVEGPDLLGPELPPPGRGTFFGPPKPTLAADYWVISTRNCPQSDSPCDADKCTQYFYRGPSGKVEQRSAAEFFQTLNPAEPVCMMIHGSLTEWDQALREGHATYEWLKRAAPNTRFRMVLFTWPSDRAVTLLPPIDFSVLGRRSSFNGLYLGRVLAQMPPSTSVSLIGHSHGARLAVSALHLLGGGDVSGYRLSHRDSTDLRIRTVLAAAAMDHQWLDPKQRYGKALQSTESLLNLRNQTDLPLMLYPFPMLLGHDSLGRGGFSWYDRYALGSEYSKIRNVEVTFMLGFRHIWPRFHDHPEIARLIAPYAFFQQDIPSQSTVWYQRPQAAARASHIAAQPGHRTEALSKSTLVKGTVQPPVRAAEDYQSDVSREPAKGMRSPSAVRVFPQTSRSRPLENDR